MECQEFKGLTLEDVRNELSKCVFLTESQCACIHVHNVKGVFYNLINKNS